MVQISISDNIPVKEQNERHVKKNLGKTYYLLHKLWLQKKFKTKNDISFTLRA